MTGSYSTTPRRGRSIVSGCKCGTTQGETGTACTQRRRTLLSIRTTGTGYTIPCPGTGTAGGSGDGRRAAGTCDSGRIGRDSNGPCTPGTVLLTSGRLRDCTSSRLALMSGRIGHAAGRCRSIVGSRHCSTGTGETRSAATDCRSSLFRAGDNTVSKNATDSGIGQG